jgi:hypothetical protein
MKSAVSLFAIVLSCSLPPAAEAAALTEPLEQAQSPSAAERIVLESLYDLTGSYYRFPCSADGELLPIEEGELIQMEGKIYERWTLVWDGSGAYHFKLNIMPTGLRGTSVETGEEFRVSEESQNTANRRLDGGSGMYREVLKMVGKDTRRVFFFVASGNYRVSSDGETIVDRSAYRLQCR